MINKVLAMPRMAIEKWLKELVCPFDNWALISIHKDHELMNFKNVELSRKLGCQKCLSLCFDDITLDQYKTVGEETQKQIKLFNKQDAIWTINFLDEVNKENIPTLIVHCAAGVSRSGAVGLFATKYLKLNGREFHENNKTIMPNQYVLEILNKESGIADGYIEWWKREIERMDNYHKGRPLF